METKNLYNLNKLISLSNGDNDFVLKMLSMFVQNIPQSIELMVEAVDKNDMQELGFVAHKIKTSVDMLGIVSLQQKLRDLENLEKNGIQKDQVSLLLTDVILTLNEVIQSIKKILVVGV